jgi:hypothetical protein
LNDTYFVTLIDLYFLKQIAMFRGLKAKAKASFVVFIIVFSKDILVSGLHLIPERSRFNREISWFFIVPVSLIGVVFSLRVIRDAYLKKKKEGGRLFNINVLFALPLLLYISLFIMLAIMAIVYEIFI